MRIYTKGKTKEEKRAYYREYMKERRASYKEHGQCVQCGRNVLKGHTLCELCNNKQLKIQKLYDERKRKS